MRTGKLLATTAIILSLIAIPAIAQTPTGITYGDPIDQTNVVAGVKTTTVANTKSGASLPSTGLQIALVVGSGGVLLLLGFGMRRAIRPGPPAV
jgi:hypothetical protein